MRRHIASIARAASHRIDRVARRALCVPSGFTYDAAYLTRAEHDALAAVVDARLGRRRYERDHWDAVIARAGVRGGRRSTRFVAWRRCRGLRCAVATHGLVAATPRGSSCGDVAVVNAATPRGVSRRRRGGCRGDAAATPPRRRASSADQGHLGIKPPRLERSRLHGRLGFKSN